MHLCSPRSTKNPDKSNICTHMLSTLMSILSMLVRTIGRQQFKQCAISNVSEHNVILTQYFVQYVLQTSKCMFISDFAFAHYHKPKHGLLWQQV